MADFEPKISTTCFAKSRMVISSVPPTLKTGNASPASTKPPNAVPAVLIGTDAMSVVPVVSELNLTETSAGLRPGTPDNGPVLGPAGPAGLLIATGHYRNGILLSAATADAAVACLAGQPPAAEWEPFSPQRFTVRAGAP